MIRWPSNWAMISPTGVARRDLSSWKVQTGSDGRTTLATTFSKHLVSSEAAGQPLLCATVPLPLCSLDYRLYTFAFGREDSGVSYLSGSG